MKSFLKISDDEVFETLLARLWQKVSFDSYYVAAEIGKMFHPWFPAVARQSLSTVVDIFCILLQINQSSLSSIRRGRKVKTSTQQQ